MVHAVVNVRLTVHSTEPGHAGTLVRGGAGGDTDAIVPARVRVARDVWLLTQLAPVLQRAVTEV